MHLLEDTSEVTAAGANRGPADAELNGNKDRENVTRFNISIVKQALESDYALKASDDDDVELDDVEIDS